MRCENSIRERAYNARRHRHESGVSQLKKSFALLPPSLSRAKRSRSVLCQTFRHGCAEITVLCGGAIEPGLKAAAAAFEKQSGHHVKITFNTTPQIRSASTAATRSTS